MNCIGKYMKIAVTASVTVLLAFIPMSAVCRNINSIEGQVNLRADATWKLSESIYVHELSAASTAGIIADAPVFVFYTRATDNISGPAVTNVHGELTVGNVTYVPVSRLITIEDKTLETDFTGEAYAGALIVLKNSILTGKLEGVSLTMDDTSIWHVTGDSRLIGADFNRSYLNRVFGNGHHVMFDGEVALSADFREFPEELSGEDSQMEENGSNILMPVLPKNVEALITSPNYVDGTTDSYRGPVTLTEDISVTSDQGPVNNSAIYVKNGGRVRARGNAGKPLAISHTSRTSTVYTDGTDRTRDAMMKMGVSSIVYANAGGNVDLKNFRIAGTTNGFYAIYGGTVRAENGFMETSSLHGVQVCFGGKIYLKDMEVHTTGGQGSVLSSDFGGGWIYADNVTGSSQTTGSAGIYADGYSYIYVTDSRLTAHNDSAAVLCAGGEMTVTNTILESGGTSRNGEVNAVIYIHPNGNNPRRVSNGYFTDCRFIGEGDVFNLDAKSTNILLKGRKTTIEIPEGRRLISANNIAPGARTLDQAWPLSPNVSTFTLEDVTLSGDIFVEPDGAKLNLILKEGTTYTGVITRAAVSIEADATWTLTGDAIVTGVDFDLKRIKSRGYNIYYDAGLAENAVLEKKPYDLPGGGKLLPVNVIVIENAEMTADHNADMYALDTMLVLTNSTLTGELHGISLAMDKNSIWNVSGTSSPARVEFQNQVVITDGSIYTGAVQGVDMTVSAGGMWQVTGNSTVVNLDIADGAKVISDRAVTVAFGASDTMTEQTLGRVTYENDKTLLPPEPAMEMRPPGGGPGGPSGGGRGNPPAGGPPAPAM